MDFKYIDTHGHLNDRAFDNDREEIINDLKKSNIATTIVGTDFEMSKKALELANKNEGRYAIIGQHPHDNKDENFDYDQYLKWAKDERVVAVGECGLDYFWPIEIGEAEKEKKEKDRQKELFLKQIEIARIVDKPLVIHGRPSKGKMDAYNEILEILNTESQKSGSEIKGVAHFFAGDVEVARKFLNLGFYFSFTGVVTFVDSYNEIIKYIPKDRIMAETDSPYVAPSPHRGKRNETKYVIEVYKALARIYEEDFEIVRSRLNSNAHLFFKI